MVKPSLKWPLSQCGECGDLQITLIALELRRLQEQNKKLRECVVDMVKVLRAYDSLNIELRNMPGVRKLYDPEIIHYETIEQCLKEIDKES